MAISAATTLSTTVEASGMNHSRPNSRKRKSPGRRPTPSFCSSGDSQLMKIVPER